MQRAQLVEHVDRDLEGLGSNPNVLHIFFSHPITFGALPTQVLLKIKPSASSLFLIFAWIDH